MSCVKPIYGDVAILADSRPLDPHVTLRLALATDSTCECGHAATFVLLRADRAAEPPHFPDLKDRICDRWLDIHQAICLAHLESAIRDASRRVLANDA